MRFLILQTMVGLFASSLAWGNCTPQYANLTFAGTAFSSQPFQVAANRVQFFSKTERETAFFYSRERKQWCYSAKNPKAPLVSRTCMSQHNFKGKHMIRVGNVILQKLVLRDVAGLAVATVQVASSLLTLNFVDESGRFNGKRVVFKGHRDDGTMELKAWNCPNSRFLSCAGSFLQTYFSESEFEDEPAIKTAELSQGVNRFDLRCNGLFEAPDESAPNPISRD